MENPYYEIVALMRALGSRGGEGLFSATVQVDEAERLFLEADGLELEADLWLAGGLTLTKEDKGRTVLCLPFDRGFLILCTVSAL